MHTDAKQTGDIMFSTEILNQIQHNIIWGQKTNLMSVPTDCDQRDERKVLYLRLTCVHMLMIRVGWEMQH